MKSERQREKEERLEIGAITTLNDSRRPVPPRTSPRPGRSSGAGKRGRAKSPSPLPAPSSYPIRVAEVAEVYYRLVALNFYPIRMPLSRAICPTPRARARARAHTT